MTDSAPRTTSRRRLLALGGLGALVVVTATPVAASRWRDVLAGATTAGDAADGGGGDGGGGGGLFSPDRVHAIDVAIDDDAFDQAVATYHSSGDKTWLEVAVTIDGTTHERCGIRLKGNSTLRTIDRSAGPEQYPWLLRLDKFVDGQDHDGLTELALRSNTSASSLNEAVALDLLAATGLASQAHGYATVTVGDASVLRLVVEHPGDTWVAGTFGGAGLLYKAEATGDYSYRGTDPAAYGEVFDQESGDTDDLTPLIEFLRFVDESTDAEFASTLGDHLDVPAFADYLALEDLMDNFDAIDGPGNNSYLWWDEAADRMTVVAWDHNLTFGVRNGPGEAEGGLGGPGGARPDAGGAVADVAAGGAGAAGGHGPGGRTANPLVTRFEAVDAFSTLVSEASARLRQALYAGGVATASLEAWAGLLADDAADLLDADTLADEKAAIAAYVG